MISFKSVAGSKNNYQILCRNTGQTELECKSYIELSELKNRQENNSRTCSVSPYSPSREGIPILRYHLTWRKEKYSVLAVIDAGEDDIPVQASEAIIDVE